MAPSEDNKEVVRSFVEVCQNGHDLAAAEARCGPPRRLSADPQGGSATLAVGDSPGHLTRSNVEG